MYYSIIIITHSGLSTLTLKHKAKFVADNILYFLFCFLFFFCIEKNFHILCEFLQNEKNIIKTSFAAVVNDALWVNCYKANITLGKSKIVPVNSKCRSVEM